MSLRSGLQDLRRIQDGGLRRLRTGCHVWNAATAAPMYTTMTQAEQIAEFDTEAIELASRAHADIQDYDEWPEGVARPIARNS